jgi:hypothetical protein
LLVFIAFVFLLLFSLFGLSGVWSRKLERFALACGGFMASVLACAFAPSFGAAPPPVFAFPRLGFLELGCRGFFVEPGRLLSRLVISFLVLCIGLASLTSLLV